MEHYLARLRKAVTLYWQRDALCDYRGEKFTFGELAENIERLHILFEKIGIKKGEKIALCAKNSARWGISFFAANTYEAVVVPILNAFTPDKINYLVNHSESVVLFTDSDIWNKLDIRQMPLLKTVICVKDFSLLYCEDEADKTILKNYDKFLEEKYPSGFSQSDVSYPINNEKNLAVINYTSGTTSDPKGVMLRYECISSNVAFGQKRLPSYPEDKMVSMLPMAHMYGLIFELIYPLCGGTSIYYLGKTPTPAFLLGAMSEVKPYLIITVPLVMEKIFKSSIQPIIEKGIMKILIKIPIINGIIYKKIHDKLLSALGGKIRMIIMGGAAFSPEIEKWFRKFKIPYTVGYGMTEAAPLLAYEAYDRFVPKSCGKIVDRCEVRIDSEDSQKVAGEIQVRGTNIMSGYFKNEEATKAAFTADGWMNTGDLGVIDSDGNIFIRGRNKNMILSSNGQNIYPEEIEAAVNNKRYVVESVVIDRDSKLVALIYLDKDLLEKDNIDSAGIMEIMENIKNSVNKEMPAYSKLSRTERVAEPFEKTPKMSIKRYLYK